MLKTPLFPGLVIGQTFKVRSTQFSVQDFANETLIGQLDLSHASKTIEGILKDAQGNPVPNGKLVLWGEVFTTDSNGEYQTTPMPSDAEETVSIELPGFQKTTIEITFAYPTPPEPWQLIPTESPRIGPSPPWGTFRRFSSSQEIRVGYSVRWTSE